MSMAWASRRICGMRPANGLRAKCRARSSWPTLPAFSPDDRVRDDPRFLRKLDEAGLLVDSRSAWAEYLAWKKRTGEP